MKLFSDPIPNKARTYILTVILSGTPIFLYSLYHVSLNLDARWLFLVLLASLGSCFPVVIPLVRGNKESLSVTVSDVFIFASILLFGPESAVILSVIEGFITSYRAKIKRWYKHLFNASQLALSAFLVGKIFYSLQDMPAPLDPERSQDVPYLILQVSLCGIVYFLANTLMVAFAVSLVSRDSFVELWKQNFVWASLTHLAGACLGALIFVYFREIEVYSMALAAPIVVLLYYAYKMNLDRIKRTQRHLDEVNRLLAEKIEAEKALQMAKEDLEVRVLERTTELRNANYQLLIEVNERNQAEKALEAEKERLAVTLRSIGDGVITTDTGGCVVLMNNVAEELTGMTQQQSMGRPLLEVYELVESSSYTRCQDPALKVLETGAVYGADVKNLTLRACDGSERRVSQSAAPILDQQGRTLGVVLVFRDISQQLKLEEQLLNAQKLESVGVLAGGIAHDFNNILSGILLKTQLARRAWSKGQEADKFLVSVEEATQMASALTQQLLTFAKGGAPIKKAVSLQNLLEESARFALRGSKIRCHFKLPEDLWTVEADEGQISQVINNLVINAEQASPNGGRIILRAESVYLGPNKSIAELPEGPYVKISVEDEGVGIPPEHLPRVFDPYFTTKQKGHGLGLASTYSIIQRHGGHITLESRVGAGSTFTFYLPASEGAAAEQRVQKDELTQGSGRILVMDDEELIREGLGELLLDLGYHVEFAAEGSEAIASYQQALAEAKPFDAVIMDLTIPGGMGGKEAIQKLLEIDPKVTAIVSSGYSSDPVMANYLEHGFQAVLAKPLRVDQISRVLAQTLSTSGAL